MKPCLFASFSACMGVALKLQSSAFSFLLASCGFCSFRCDLACVPSYYVNELVYVSGVVKICVKISYVIALLKVLTRPD